MNKLQTLETFPWNWQIGKLVEDGLKFEFDTAPQCSNIYFPNLTCEERFAGWATNFGKGPIVDLLPKGEKKDGLQNSFF